MTKTQPGLAATIAELNKSYETIHTTKEDAFWATMMGLGDNPEANRTQMQELSVQVQRFLGDSSKLSALRALQTSIDASQEDAQDLVALKGWIHTLESHAIESEEARTLAEEILADESALARSRGQMKLGYKDAEGNFVEASSVELRLRITNCAEENDRKSAWEAIRSIETHVLANGFVELVQKRNKLGRLLGGEDYYDATVRRVEGMTKKEIFDLLDDLEERTRDAAQRSLNELKERVGADKVTSWNIRNLVAGDITKKIDPYFPFSQSLERWGRSFAAMGIDYRNSTMVLDLVERKGKYENGFMHGPVPAWNQNGEHRPARIHFTANAVPGVVGSGIRATQTLFHEGGHAAHFSNIDMPAPCFAQEFAPSSVAFAETQSMFLDSILSDADWRTRYAKTTEGETIPFELIEEALRSSQPFAAWGIRAMLAVCYSEKAIYEIPDEELTAERILQEIRAVESKMLLLEDGSHSPALAIPHLLSGESSAYYHGYVLADVAVYQTRDFFIERDGHLLDNPKIGPDLQKFYWAPGNSKPFLQFIQEFTGSPLSAQHLADHVNQSADEAIAAARALVEKEPSIPHFNEKVELNTSLTVIHGDETIATTEGGDFASCATSFEAWINRLRAEKLAQGN